MVLDHKPPIPGPGARAVGPPPARSRAQALWRKPLVHVAFLPYRVSRRPSGVQKLLKNSSGHRRLSAGSRELSDDGSDGLRRNEQRRHTVLVMTLNETIRIRIVSEIELARTVHYLRKLFDRPYNKGRHSICSCK